MPMIDENSTRQIHTKEPLPFYIRVSMEISNDSYLFTNIFLRVQDIPDSPPEFCRAALSNFNKL